MVCFTTVNKGVLTMLVQIVATGFCIVCVLGVLAGFGAVGATLLTVAAQWLQRTINAQRNPAGYVPNAPLPAHSARN